VNEAVKIPIDDPGTADAIAEIEFSGRCLSKFVGLRRKIER
jgi:hypothetical protein